MTITAKLIDGDMTTVTNVELSNDPTEVELIAALGATGGPLMYFGQMAGYVIMRGSGSTSYLMLGSTPYLSHHGGPQERVSCSLSDERVLQMVKFFKTGWEQLGFPKL